MLSFDWTNAFLLVVIVTLFLFALRTDNGGMRTACHIVIFITLMTLLQPIFAVLYGGFAGYHVLGGER
jgi:hypothetical protein